MKQENLIRIPFTEKEYYVTPHGEIISNVYGKMNKLRGRPFLDSRIRTFDVVSNTSKKVTIYSHRILFFFYIYPFILKKKASSMTLQEYRDMGDIVLKNSRRGASLSNILIVPKQNKVGERIEKNSRTL